ncbi:carbohydrate porin [Thiolinea disciformis]|uniref:carbohydrate porin n=1 Tax=Thiolinea disciformis TaxID=125614 RepID=UPI0003673DD0|nr:carbohydrate porin [Thiolinea disciformis]
MKTTFKVGILSGLVALLAATGVQAADGDYSNTFTFGGDVELDITSRSPSDSNDTFGHGGRIKLNAVGQANRGDYFVKGVAQPLVPFKGSDLGYDDVYFQFGQKMWDVQLGRFEGIDLFPAGKDTVVEHAGGLGHYGTNHVRGRKDDVLHTAVHIKPSEAVQVELGTMYKKDGDDDVVGYRPAATFKAGPAAIRVGAENLTTTTSGKEVEKKGAGISAGVSVAGGSANLNYAQGTNDNVDHKSIGANFTKGPFGLGYIHHQQDATTASGDDPKVDTIYAAYSVPLFSFKDATVTFAGSTSKAKNVTTDDKVNAFRVRFNYAF